MNIPESLSPIIKEILDTELAEGNAIGDIIIEDNGTIGIEMKWGRKVKLGHILKIERQYKECSLIQGQPDHPKIGENFTDKNTGHYIQYVERIKAESPYDFLSPNLIPLLDMELKLGNKIHSAEAWTWSKVPYEVFMK
ncbi:MAG: hypothetical protein EYC62_01010, partial [Alphaproteobacteria bacterium]